MASAPRNKSHAHDFHAFHKPFASSSASTFASKSPTFFTRRSCSPSPSVRFSIDQRPDSPGRSSISVTKQETSKKINNTVSSSSSSSSHNRVARNFQKKTCSCSPTTHPGSFRCSLHKASSSSTSSTRGSGQRTASYGLNFRRSAMTNSLVRIGAVEGGDLVKRALSALIRPSSHQQRRRAAFQPRPSRLSVMSQAQAQAQDNDHDS